MYEARYWGDCISLYNPTCASRVHTCHLPRDIQQICCNTQTGQHSPLQGHCNIYIHTCVMLSIHHLVAWTHGIGIYWGKKGLFIPELLQHQLGGSLIKVELCTYLICSGFKVGGSGWELAS